MPIKFDRKQVKVVKKIAEIARDGLNIPRQDLKELAETMAKKMRVRTRLGFGVNAGYEKKLRGLGDIYIAQRRRLESKRELYDETTPPMSNLTKTGQLLNSLYGVSERKNEFAVRVKEKRKETKVTNSEIIGYQKEDNRDFFGFSKAEIAFIQKQVILYFKKVFKL